VPDLFDIPLRAARRDRALRTGPVLFLLERAFDDILERLALVQREFRTALLLGCPAPGWPERLAGIAADVSVVDPGAGFAREAGGRQVVEDRLDVEPASFDLAVAIGTLDTANDLPQALLRLRFALKPDSLLIGAMSGGETLPRIRRAMRAADAVTGSAAPHIHPRIEPAGFAQLLGAAGFSMPVVDVDRARVGYRSFAGLVADLRGMAATNVLAQRPRTPLPRAAYLAAAEQFESEAEDGRTVETFEILHFAAWTPKEG
jgi:hypothetical protein